MHSPDGWVGWTWNSIWMDDLSLRDTPCHIRAIPFEILRGAEWKKNKICRGRSATKLKYVNRYNFQLEWPILLRISEIVFLTKSVFRFERKHRSMVQRKCYHLLRVLVHKVIFSPSSSVAGGNVGILSWFEADMATWGADREAKNLANKPPIFFLCFSSIHFTIVSAAKY